MVCLRLDASPYLRLCETRRLTPPGGPLLVDVEAWTCGFRPVGSAHDHRDSHLLADIAMAADMASVMSDYWLSSDSDVPFFPFVGQLTDQPGSQTASLLRVLGVTRQLPIDIRDISARTHFAWDEERFDEDDPVSDYYNVDEIEAYAATTSLMHTHLTDLREADFFPVDMSRPVFWYGRRASGNLVGLFSVRADT